MAARGERCAGRGALFWALAAAAVTARAAAILLLASPEAGAAGCCKVTYSADRSRMTITGILPYEGDLVTVSFGGKKCLSDAGPGKAYVKATVPTKYYPNGRYAFAIVQKVGGEIVFTKRFFTISGSPAVSVQITKPKAPLLKTPAADFTLATKGAVTSTSCTLDGKRVPCNASRLELDGLSEGRHVVEVVAKGKDGFSAKARKAFTVDTQAPTAPNVTGGGEWTNETVQVAASGSRDAGTGIGRYEWRKSSDGGATWSRIQRSLNTYVDREGETIVAFRAVDRAGRASAWAETVVRIDRTPPEAPPVVVVETGDPCTQTYPVTLTASGGSDALSGIGSYEFLIQRWNGETYVETGATDTATLTEPTTYYVYVTAIDRAGNESQHTEWSSQTCG